MVKGTVSDGTTDAGQLDIILCRPHSHLRPLGNQYLVEKSDALCVIEVKGNCTGRDLRGAAAKALVIRNLQGEPKPLFGVICYPVDLELKTIMNRFGYSFDSVTNTYFDNATIPKEDEPNWRKIEYPDLDFFISLQDEKKLFLRKYQFAPGKYRFIRNTRTPIIQDIFALVRSLWIPANSETTN